MSFASRFPKATDAQRARVELIEKDASGALDGEQLGNGNIRVTESAISGTYSVVMDTDGLYVD